jgi:hypothetical protein
MAISEEQDKRIRAFEKQVLPKCSNWYGMKHALYKSVGLPASQPATCHLQHGTGMMLYNRKPDHLTLNTHYPVIFLENEQQLEICKRYQVQPITKPMYIIGGVFPRYRRSQGIEQRPDAKGSLVFISHSTPSTAVDSDWKQLMEQYRQLPEQYHPLTFSIYYRDYLLGVHEYFINEGFDVVTAGHIADPHFVDTFYQTLSQFKYVIANDVGSHLYYAVEMGIPFFLHGPKGHYKVVHQEEGLDKEDFEMTDYDYINTVYQRFAVTPEEVAAGVVIKPEQRAFVDKTTGKHVALSDGEIRDIIQRTKWRFYAKELLLSPIKLPLKWYRSIKARTKKEIH